MSPSDAIAQRCREVLRRVPPGVTVVAATKGRVPDEVRQAIAAGIGHIGENYVQDAERKRGAVPEPATWHMIGRLQTNKVNRAARAFDWVQTIHSPELARRLSASCAAHGKELPVLLQVNIGREPNKGGALPEEIPALAQEVRALPSLHLRGLMAIPPAGERPEDTRPHFRAMRKLFAALQDEGFDLDTLSMGMSVDWEVAVEEGATMIRLGTLLFGPRSAD